jgi:hypothetical protein
VSGPEVVAALVLFRIVYRYLYVRFPIRNATSEGISRPTVGAIRIETSARLRFMIILVVLSAESAARHSQEH